MESLADFAVSRGIDPDHPSTLTAYSQALAAEQARLAEDQGVTVEALHTGQAAMAATTAENGDDYVPLWHPV